MPAALRAIATILALTIAPAFATTPPSESAPAADDRVMSFAYAIYYTGSSGTDPIARVRAQADVAGGRVALIDEFLEDVAGPLLTATVVEDAQTELPPPQGDSLQYFTRDLSDAELSTLAASSHVLVLTFAHPQRLALPALARADRVAYDVAQALDGVLYDVELRRAVGAARWQSGRLASGAEALPSVIEHTAIHAYRDGDWIRSVTVGMRKLGLPELAATEVSAGNSTQVAWLINAIGQRMIEGQRPDPEGWFDLDLRTIKHLEVRERITAEVKSNGTAKGRFQLTATHPQEGDADNLLLALGFDAYDGPDTSARQNAAVSEVFGRTDTVKYIAHDDELEAASQRAREQLPALRNVVQRGLKPGELVQVKLPFATPDGGSEWMWVEVLRWNGDTIEGVLSNEPFNIPDLHAGQRVQGSMDDVFDYLYQRADGAIEGNETTEIILRMQGEESRRGG